MHLRAAPGRRMMSSDMASSAGLFSDSSFPTYHFTFSSFPYATQRLSSSAQVTSIRSLALTAHRKLATEAGDFDHPPLDRWKLKGWFPIPFLHGPSTQWYISGNWMPDMMVIRLRQVIAWFDGPSLS